LGTRTSPPHFGQLVAVPTSCSSTTMGRPHSEQSNSTIGFSFGVGVSSCMSMPLSERQLVFQALVRALDSGSMSVPQSRRLIARRYGLTAYEVWEIEEQGPEEDWPPLD
jgi:hypothetical protein